MRTELPLTPFFTEYFRVPDIFPVNSVGIVTARDKFTIHPDPEEIYRRVMDLSTLSIEQAEVIYKTGEDSRDWRLLLAKQDILDSEVDRNKITPILYRPFDVRYTYYTGRSRGFLSMPRPGVMKNMIEITGNIGLVTVCNTAGSNFNHAWIAGNIIDSRLISTSKGTCYLFPLYLYSTSPDPENENGKQDNVSPYFIARLEAALDLEQTPTAAEIFFYIYAVLSSPLYEQTHRDILKNDFPYIPIPKTREFFFKMSRIGKLLAGVHLLKAPEVNRTFSSFPIIGSNIIDKVTFTPLPNKVYINKEQYFSNISSDLWEIRICGCPVLSRWLRMRKGEQLEHVDIVHFLRIARAVQLTVEYRKECDKLYYKEVNPHNEKREAHVFFKAIEK